jgi:hypothetical protein
MNKYILISLLFAWTYIHGQTNFYIKNKDTNEPISYANIWNSNKVVTTSDSIGKFILDKDFQNLKFKITAVGFKTIDNISFNEKREIVLEEDFIKLEEIKIAPKKNKQIFKLGDIKNGDIGVCAEKNKQIAQVGKYFKNELNEKTFLKKIRFKSICSNNNRMITISLYSVDENGSPNEIINNKNIVCNLKKGHNISDIDISHLNISFPTEGIVVVVNYLFLEQNKEFGKINKDWYFYEPSIDAEKKESFFDTWYSTGDKWMKIEKYSLNFQLILTN